MDIKSTLHHIARNSLNKLTPIYLECNKIDPNGMKRAEKFHIEYCTSTGESVIPSDRTMLELSQEENLTTDGYSFNPCAKDSDGVHIPFLSRTYKTKDNVQRSISNRQIGDRIVSLRVKKFSAQETEEIKQKQLSNIPLNYSEKRHMKYVRLLEEKKLQKELNSQIIELKKTDEK